MRGTNRTHEETKKVGIWIRVSTEDQAKGERQFGTETVLSAVGKIEPQERPKSFVGGRKVTSRFMESIPSLDDRQENSLANQLRAAGCWQIAPSNDASVGHVRCGCQGGRISVGILHIESNIFIKFEKRKQGEIWVTAQGGKRCRVERRVICIQTDCISMTAKIREVLGGRDG